MIKIDYVEKKQVRVNETLEYNISDILAQSIKTKVINNTNKINENQSLTSEQKTERLKNITFEHYVKQLVNNIFNAIISTHELSDKKIEINGKTINTDNKKINGKSDFNDIKAFNAEINEFLSSGMVTVNDKKMMIRQTQYVIGKNDKNIITHTFIDIKKFNMVKKSERDFLKSNKMFYFAGYRIA